MSHKPADHLSPDRLARRREHLMTEIAQQHAPATTPDLAPARRRWSPRVRLLTAAASIAVLVIGISVFAATTGGPTGRGPAAFAIENLPGGKVSIRVVNNTVSAAQMTRQLQDVGLSITIDAVPASPQLVGRWLTTGASEDVPGTVIDDLTQQALGKTATLDITRTFPGQITLTVGRSPRVGEDPQVSGTPNALSPGGLLYCQRLSGQIPSAAAKSLTDAGYTVSWAVGGVRRSVATAPDGTRVVKPTSSMTRRSPRPASPRTRRRCS